MTAGTGAQVDNRYPCPLLPPKPVPLLRELIDRVLGAFIGCAFVIGDLGLLVVARYMSLVEWPAHALAATMYESAQF
jgi:hypothetical protein